MLTLSIADVENVLRTIFRRCYECPLEVPSCPTCPSGQVCSQVAASCTSCASTVCIKVSDLDGNNDSSKSHGPNVGAIAGGVVGGVAVIVALTWIVWRYCLKGRRQQLEETDWEEEEIEPEKPASEFTMRKDARASTHTVASLASTVLTRASNIIQIAYIPGVTNRSGPQSPGLLVPPVPPIPIATTSSSASTPYSTEDRHFFVPGDLRDSTYSGYTDYTTDARTSIAPSLARSSVATTIYRSNAIVSPLPAQTVVRGKAAVVSVKSSQSNSPMTSPEIDTPPVPPIDPAKIVKGPIRIQMPASSDATGLSPASSLRSTATVGKPTTLTITKKGKAVPTRTPSSESNASAEKPASPDISPPESITNTPRPDRPETSNSFLTSDSESESETELDHARSRRSLLRQSVASSSKRDSQLTTSTESPSIASPSPFADMSSSIMSPGDVRSPHRHSGLSTVLEGTDDERSRRGSKASSKAAAAGADPSPFGDENAVGRTP